MAAGSAEDSSCCMRTVLTSASLGKWQLLGAEGSAPMPDAQDYSGAYDTPATL